MKKIRFITIVNIIGLGVLAALSLPLVPVEGQTGHEEHTSMGLHKGGTGQVLSLAQVHAGHLPMALKSLDGAAQAVELGDKKKALEELAKTKKLLLAIHKTVGAHIKPAFVNARCPIMGGVIKPEKVTKDLIREHKGQKVAFCCAGCPASWDKLSASQKEAKLTKVLIAKEVWTCAMHPQVRLDKAGRCPICGMDLIKAKGAASSKPVVNPHAGHKH